MSEIVSWTEPAGLGSVAECGIVDEMVHVDGHGTRQNGAVCVGEVETMHDVETDGVCL